MGSQYVQTTLPCLIHDYVGISVSVFLLFIEPVRLSTRHLGMPRQNTRNRGHTSMREAVLRHTIAVTSQVSKILPNLQSATNNSGQDFVLAGDKQKNGFSERRARWNLGTFHSTFSTNIFALNKAHLFSQPRNGSNSRGSTGNVQTTSTLTNVKLRILPAVSHDVWQQPIDFLLTLNHIRHVQVQSRISQPSGNKTKHNVINEVLSHSVDKTL